MEGGVDQARDDRVMAESSRARGEVEFVQKKSAAFLSRFYLL